MRKIISKSIQLSFIINVSSNRCYWCGQQLRLCGACKGTGKFHGEACKACLKNGWLCPTHEGDWTES